MPESELKTWFLGPKGENAALLEELTCAVIARAARWREGDGVVGAASATSSAAAGVLEQRVEQLLDYVQQRTVPAFSSRYQAHMGWDLLLPGIIGNLVGVLFPSNNVAYEGSPATTVLEMLVGYDLCRMLGYSVTPTGEEQVMSWGHLVGGGTIANIEALWAARNLKYLPLALRETLKDARYQAAQAVTVKQRSGKPRPLLDLSAWELLNLPLDESLSLPKRATSLLGENDRQDFEFALNQQGLNQKSLLQFYLDASLKDVGPPRILLSHDNHYSLEKAAALLGLGQDSLIFIEVDGAGRMKVDQLAQRLQECACSQVPVLAVVSNLGSTELGAVDDLCGILDLRRKLAGQPEFMVHVDGAFGGYHASLLRDDFPLEWPFKVDGASGVSLGAAPVRSKDKVPEIGLSAAVRKQYEALPLADSIAVDPHKLGFLPYPSGAICYRNSALRDLTKFSAPYLGSVVPQAIRQVDDRTDQFMGVFGVEGSKSGGAAAGVFLAHSLLRPSRSGYGRLSGKALYASKRVFAALASLNEQSKLFGVAAAGTYPPDEANYRRLVSLADLPDGALSDDDRRLLEECGPDLNLLLYLFNFRLDEKSWNQDLVWMNVFNLLIYGQLDLQPEAQEKRELIVAQTIFSGREGTDFIKGMLGRLKVNADDLGSKTELFAMRSAEWNPWITEQDPKLQTFRRALSIAATSAHAIVIATKAKSEAGVADARARGLSDVAIASGIVGAVVTAAQAGESASKQQIGLQQIAGGLSLIQQKMTLPNLPEKALAHFAGPQ
jgi:glutamate/tyrosine decarboxylase-like PLP-dependent enzyme